MIRKLFSNDYSLNLFNKVITIIMGLFSSVFLTRYLGVELRGEYGYITQIVSILSIFLNLGLHQSYSYYYKKSEDKIKLFNDYINIYILQFILYLISSLILSFFLENKLFVLSILLVPSTVLLIAMEATMAVENIRLKIKVHIYSLTLKTVCFMIIYFFLDTSLFIPILIIIITNIINAILYLFYYKIKPNIFNVDFIFLKTVINFSWIPMLTSLLVTLNYNVDIFFLEYAGDYIELGLYSTAVGIINYIWIIPDAFKEVLVSRVTRTDSNTPTIFAAKISFYAVLTTILGFFLFGELFIKILYGESFVDSYLVTVILSLGSISMLYYKIIGVQFLAEGKRYFYFFTLFFSVILNVVLNYFLIPNYGMYGAAITSILSYTVCGGTFLFYFTKVKQVKILEFFVFNENEVIMLKKILSWRDK